jgi:hypothetical protein
MASALTALANATATFTVAGSATITDPETGNIKPVDESVVVSLFLKAEKQRNRQFPGVDIEEVFFEGYAVEALDSRVLVGTLGSLSFSSETAVDCEVLELRTPYGDTGLIGDVLAKALGEKIVLVSRKQR